MITDPSFGGFSSSMNGYIIDRESIFPNSVQYPNFTNDFIFNGPSLDLNSMHDLFVDSGNLVQNPSVESGNLVQSLSESTEGGYSSPSDETDFSETMLKYINQMLMEENMEAKPCMFHDPLALQAAEKSLYEVIGEKYPSSSSPEQAQTCNDGNNRCPPYNCSSVNSDHSSNGGSSSSSNSSNMVDLNWNADFGESKPSLFQKPIPPTYIFQSTPKSETAAKPLNKIANNGKGMFDSSVSEKFGADLFNNSELVLKFKKGMEEASKFLPKGNQLIIDLEESMFPPSLKENVAKVVVKAEKEENEADYLPNGLMRGKRNLKWEYKDLEEERSHKQSAVYTDDSELSELFDKVLLCPGGKEQPMCCTDETLKNGASNTLQQNGKTNGGKSHSKKQSSMKEVEIVDLSSLLIPCAQAVSSGDQRTANELLRQIRQHSSPFGDGNQRLAHYFANALEARSAGTGAQIYTALSAKQSSAADMLKAYQAYLSVCPFLKISVVFANDNILKLSEKATTLHVIDFGILYGFQWPSLIQSLSRRPDGPPKLRITGIELPQHGFRPAERVLETGRRLAKYCERFNVPFEYNGIAQKWENIRIEDLKINPNEFLAVNSVFLFKNLLDETVVMNSPKNTVLNLIRKANPDIFIQTHVDGMHGVPFFVSRFREAVFHFSALFDICDTTMTSEDPMRLEFEKEFYGRDVLNIVACEGLERVERPETHKHWQVRNAAARFKQLPLDPEIMKKLRAKVKMGYHNDFIVCEDGDWMLQGWKGRILHASSAWVPAV